MKNTKVKIEKLNNPIQFATTEDGAPCYADACYVRTFSDGEKEMMGYRECRSPKPGRRAAAVIVELEGKGFDRKQIADAMCDGEYLGKSGLTQDVVEEVYRICVAK